MALAPEGGTMIEAMSKPGKKPQIRLKEVADEAEVSITTTSLALRNHPSVTEETRRRVLEAQKRLGYRPIRKRISAPVRFAAKAEGRNFLYCVVDFPIGKIQYAEFLNGVIDACQERGIRVELRSISSKDFGSGSLLPSDIDGVILTGEVNQDLVDFLMSHGHRVVVLGNYNVTNVHTVELDTFRAGKSIAQRMLDDGHHSAAHFLRDPRNFNERQFLMGLRDSLETGGVTLPETRIFHIQKLTEGITGAVRSIMDANPQITAITSNSVNTAEACLSEIRSLPGKKHIPMFYSIAALPGEPAPERCHLLDPGAARCGRLAVSKLCQIIDHPLETPYASVIQATGWL